MLAVTQTGLVAFDVNADDTVLPPSSLVIAEVRVRRDDARGWQPLPLTGTLLLGPDDRDLQIDARLLSYASPQGNRYRFRVQGYDQDWVEQGGAMASVPCRGCRPAAMSSRCRPRPPGARGHLRSSCR